MSMNSDKINDKHKKISELLNKVEDINDIMRRRAIYAVIGYIRYVILLLSVSLYIYDDKLSILNKNNNNYINKY